MKSFHFHLPTQVHFGWGASGEVARWASRLGGTRVLVVTDRGVRAAGLAEPVMDCLAAASLPAVLFDDVAPNPRATSVAKGAALASSEGCDVLVAVGGGSPMDTAKGIGVVLAHGGDILDHAGWDRLTRPITPLIVMPTTAGSGSEVTFVADVTDPVRAVKVTVGSPLMAARVALVDPEMTCGLSRALTASTGMDAVTHAIESYTGRSAQPLADSLCLTAMSLLAKSLPVAYADGGNRTARYDTMLGSMLAGIAVANTGNGLIHAMAQALAGRHDVPHGVANAVYLSTVLEFNSIAIPDKVAVIARALGEEVTAPPRREAAAAAVRAVRALSVDLAIPSGEEIGVRLEDLPALVEAAMEDPAVKNNPREVTEADVVALYKRAH